MRHLPTKSHKVDRNASTGAICTDCTRKRHSFAETIKSKILLMLENTRLSSKYAIAMLEKDFIQQALLWKRVFSSLSVFK